MIRVLLVHDARLLAEIEGTMLGRASFEITVTDGSGEIARLADDLRPAVVVLGEGESCPDALDVCRAIRRSATTRSASIIYIGMGLNRERALQAGADVFIPRPLTRLELREAFHRVLRLRDRIAARRRVDLPVELLLGDEIVTGTCRDLSLSGAFIVTGRQLQPGEQGTLRFSAGGRAFHLEVEVVRSGAGSSGETGIGVQFLELGADTGAYLSRFVRTTPAGGQPAEAPSAPGTPGTLEALAAEGAPTTPGALGAPTTPDTLDTPDTPRTLDAPDNP